MIDINILGKHGITCGARKDGSRAVLWDCNEITWFTAVEFNDLMTTIELSDLMISIELSEMLGA